MDLTKWKNFPYLKSCEDLEKYFENRKKGHKVFYHYTSLDAINNILKYNTIYLSSVKRFNDKKEQDHFHGDLNYYYSLCFSSGVNENLALWYLYSGINGKGGRIKFTYKKVERLIETSAYSLWECDDNGSPIKEIKKLNKDTDMIISFRDMLYARKNDTSKFYDLKYNTMTNYNKMTATELEEYDKKYKGFVKGLIWYYEKESRILIELAQNIHSMLDTKKTYLIKAKFDDEVKKSISLQFAPEFASVESILSEEKYSSIKEHIISTSKVGLSEYKGDIEMRLYDEAKIKEMLCADCKVNAKRNTTDNN